MKCAGLKQLALVNCRALQPRATPMNCVLFSPRVFLVFHLLTHVQPNAPKFAYFTDHLTSHQGVQFSFLIMLQCGISYAIPSAWTWRSPALIRCPLFPQSSFATE